ncbi:hypothetical protein KSX_56150 [Ktedonospora formicarum]|uniref:Uncharacterized protein n=1 Tax=Ktedonospora formicarum TaxID=2778364 RepID=A0A8J3I7G0_9CHLR|nr:hypothetical protein KSX_56150 [Ktedonospora formicarum]
MKFSLVSLHRLNPIPERLHLIPKHALREHGAFFSQKVDRKKYKHGEDKQDAKGFSTLASH